MSDHGPSSTGAMPRPRLRRRLAWSAGIVTAALVVGGGAVALAGNGSADASCADGTRTLEVTVAPELAPVVQAAAARVPSEALEVARECLRVHVTSTASAAVAKAVTARPPARPDVWVPDSSIWLDQVALAGVVLPPHPPSIARSPVVLAVGKGAATDLGWGRRPPTFADLVRAAGTGTVRLGLPAPDSDAAGLGDLLGLLAASRGADGRTALATMLRQQLTELPPTPAQRVELAAQQPGTAVTVSEQAVWGYNSSRGATGVVAAYSPAASSLDYPYVVLTDNAARRRAASRLLEVLQDAGTRSALAGRGFRDTRGRAPAAVTSSLGLSPQTPVAPPPSRGAVVDALRVQRVLSLGTRMLAVIDISGSMARGVASAGGASRLQETKDAATRGLSLYPDDAQIGLWVFSQNLTPRTDYRTLVPIGPLGVRPDGVLGRQQLGTTLAGLRVDPNGNTALYDTTLAAVRSVRKGWDPNRVNSVVLLTDGRNEDNEGISLTHLLSTLRRENDPARPIPVITIAFGPDSDRAALAAISQGTGGSTYVTSDANDVYAVFQDAVGRRSCRPQC